MHLSAVCMENRKALFQIIGNTLATMQHIFQYKGNIAEINHLLMTL